MKALFYWPDCPLQFNLNAEGLPEAPIQRTASRTVFWIGVSRDEVKDHLEDRMVNFNIVFRKILRSEPVTPQFYFIVPTSKSLLDPAVPWQQPCPYEKMMKDNNPWLPIGYPSWDPPYEPKGINLHTLEDLEDLERRIRRDGFIKFRSYQP